MIKLDQIFTIASVIYLGASNIYLQYQLHKMYNSFTIIEYFIARNVIEMDDLWQYINAALVPEDISVGDRRDLSFAISINHYLTKEDRELFETKLKESQAYIQQNI